MVVLIAIYTEVHGVSSYGPCIWVMSVIRYDAIRHKSRGPVEGSGGLMDMYVVFAH